VPLTHPSRDHGHGRIWRIVWHGEDNSVRPLPLPDFSHANAGELVALLRTKISSFAPSPRTNWSTASAPPDAVPALRAAPEKSAPLQVAFALERLGATDDERLFAPLSAATTDNDAALAALAGAGRPHGFRRSRRKIFPPCSRAHHWRSSLARYRRSLRHASSNWQGPLLLSMLARTPDTDPELVYALRLALKAFVAASNLEELKPARGKSAEDAERIADVAVAVAKPIAADFLLAHLERTQIRRNTRGEFARQRRA